MSKALFSGCLNHPAIEAVARCRQCAKPVCGKCVIKAQNGLFCCETCREKYTEFSLRAQKLDDREKAQPRIPLARVRVLLFKFCIFFGFAIGIYIVYSWFALHPGALDSFLPAFIRGVNH